MVTAHGTCLCGAVGYRIHGVVGEVVHCHCQTCRKAHGAAFSSVASVADSDVVWSGIEALSYYESSVGKRRYFCSRCGTQLYAKRAGTEHIILRLGSLDRHEALAEKSHIWVSQKADWFNLHATLPEFSEYE